MYYIYLNFRSRFIKPTEATLLAICHRQNSNIGKTLSFTLCGKVNGFGSNVRLVIKILNFGKNLCNFIN